MLHHQIDVTVNRDRVIGRRDFLRGISAASLAAGTLSWTDLMAAQSAELRRQGMSCILLWMQGGPSQFETFSPKPGKEEGQAKAIGTAVSGIEVCEYWPKVASVMNDLAIVRSMTSKEGNHQRATYQLHTGYAPTPTVKHPAFGSVVSRELPNQACDLPGFVRVGNFRNSAGGGLLGTEFDPFLIGRADAPPANASVTTDSSRFRRRLDLLNKLEVDYGQSGARQEVEDHRKLYEKSAKMVLSSQMKAFDLADEKDATREAYGRTQFGNGCLLARRLIETGVPFVEVSAGNWDMHENVFDRAKTLSSEVDPAFAQLVKDLKDRRMLDKTLVIWMGEFGRTPKINPRGGRDHYPRTFNVVLGGGGIKGGQVIGKTDAAGGDVKDRPVSVNDLFATFCRSMQIDAKKENMSSIGRPIKIVDGGEAVSELFG